MALLSIQIFQKMKIQKMKSINILMVMTVLLSSFACSNQINNAQITNVKIYGNCAMCKNTIEKAGNVKNTSEVVWNKETKMAMITYDANKTNQDEILKRIALAGYDSDQFLAPDNVYSQLPECCHYDRVQKSENVKTEIMVDHSIHHEGTAVDNLEVNKNVIKQEPMPEIKKEKEAINQLIKVFDHYFALKDALVKSDGTLASENAKHLFNALKAVQMNKLSDKEHTVWMKVMNNLILDAEKMKASTDLEIQRNHFITLSDNMYQLVLVSEQPDTVYFQHCPMANDGKGANWLSRENVIKNPYYGSAMLSCGKTVETLK